MRNLFERLKTKHIQKLEESKTLYPSTIFFLIMELEKNTFWADLSYSSIFTLLHHLDLYDYSPTTIQNLFDND